MHTSDTLALMRIDRIARDRLRPALYPDRRPLRITAWEAPGEPVPFAEAVAQVYSPFEIGQAWGRPWGTVWFHVTGDVPDGWSNGPDAAVELCVDLGFDTSAPGFQAEALVYRPDGSIVKAIEPRNAHVPIETETVDLYIEAAGNPSVAGTFTFAPTPLGARDTAGTEPIYRLDALHLAVRDVTVWELLQDIWTLRGLVDELEPGRTRRARVLAALTRAVDVLDPDDVAGTAAAARAELAGVLRAPASATSHTVTAVGHAHIDSAWLWPVRETVRKVARTFANVLDLIDREDGFVFAASSAQQYAWLAEHQPALFARVKAAVAAGRFIPVGGMWVESDTNMPGSEALARQFIEGKRFFLEQFGVEPLEVWLPDSFGYSAALPQIMSEAGSRWFLTQKISWNETNRMPHHTFLWEGIDGTRVFTHFPPVDTYNAELSAAELARAERQFAEKPVSSHSLVPFGWGDGGGGPTREMVAAARRTADLEGSPRVRLATPETFFREAEQEYTDAGAHPPVWSGELYLEYHRGTYSAQARTKRGNRRSEHLLREAELWATLATVRTGAEYPAEELRRLWQVVLLHQFHDILPGTSIAWVHQEAERAYAALAVDAERLIETAVRALVGEGDVEIALNAGPMALAGVPAMGGAVRGASAESSAGARRTTDARTGAARETGAVSAPVRAVRVADGWELAHPRATWLIDDQGLVVGLRDADGRELVDPARPAALLQLIRDTPREWDAWNIDAEDGELVTELRGVDTVQATPDGSGLRVVRSFGSSRLEQELRVDAETGALDIALVLDWQERQKMLKIAFPLELRADRTESEIQFGHLSRPVHQNTTWDAAKFETVAHRWLRVVEGDTGVSIANDASYGHDVRAGAGADGGRQTVARVTLVRAPLFPDPRADQGAQEFRVSVLPGAGVVDAIAHGRRLNQPLRQVRGAQPIAPALTVSDPGVVVEAVKLADDGSGDVIVRLYEALGSARTATVTPGFAWTAARQVDLLERDHEPTALVDDGGDRRTAAGANAEADAGAGVGAGVRLRLGPFQLATLRFAR